MSFPTPNTMQSVSLGTTIMAVEFEGGVVMGADSRTSSGNYVANRVSDKITQITDHIWICRSGSAADTQAISDYLKYYLHMHSIELDTPPLVKTAAALAQQICYNNKEHLLAGLIIGGWDPINGGQVYNISLGGSLVRQPFAMSGSGSTYIYGYCDAEFRPKMTQEECFKFVRNAISLAIARDGSSGGVIRTVILTKDGYNKEMLPGNQLPRFYEGL